jgi:thioesterase domain-containing protein/acyl carrier protein
MARSNATYAEDQVIPHPGVVPGEHLPLSLAQARLWELEVHETARGLHSFAIAYDLQGTLDVPALEKAIEAVVARHAGLRMRLVQTDREVYFEEMRPPGSVLQRADDLVRNGGAGSDLDSRLLEEAARPLDPTVGPPWRCVLFRRSPTEHVLLLHFHHIVADRSSVAIFVTELGAIYADLLAPDEPPAHPLPPPRRFDPSTIDQVDGARLAAGLEYWRDLFKGTPETLALPSDSPAPGFAGQSGARLEAELDPAAAGALAAQAERQSTTLFPVLLATFACLLGAHTGQEDLIVCTPMIGRHRGGTRGVIGYLNSIVPLRLDLRADPTFAELVADVAARSRSALEHQDVPFGMIAMLPELSGVRLTRCLFAVQNIPGLELRLPGVTTQYRDVPSGVVNFDLAMFVEEHEGRLRILIDFKTEVFSRPVMAEFLDRFLALARQLGAQPHLRPSDLPTYFARADAAAPQPPHHEPARDGAKPSVLEQRMLAIWRGLFPRLEEGELGVDTDFFAIGGDSLRAVRLFARVKEVFDREVPLATLLEASTPRELVRRLGDSQWLEPWNSLVAIKPDGTRPPLFCIAGGGGNVLAYRHLAACLPDEQPVYCLQAKGLRSGDRPLTTVEEMAEHYIEAIQRVRPHGPYLIAGHSFGAAVAYEMARRLTETSREVAFLGLFDHPGPDVGLTRVDWARYHLISMAMLSPRERWTFLMNAVAWRRKLSRATRGVQGLPEKPPASDWNASTRLEKSLQALRNYRLLPYPGRVTLFRAQRGSPRILADRQGGWGRVALGGIDVHEVPGTHLSMLEPPHVQALGSTLSRCLDGLATG